MRQLPLLFTWASILLCVSCCLASVDHDLKEANDLLDTISKICSDHCIEIIKAEASCEEFCQFVEHIRRDHALDLLQMYNKGGRKFDPLVCFASQMNFGSPLIVTLLMLIRSGL